MTMAFLPEGKNRMAMLGLSSHEAKPTAHKKGKNSKIMQGLVRSFHQIVQLLPNSHTHVQYFR